MREKVKDLFGKEIQIMPIEWNFGGSYILPVALVFQRAVLKKEVQSIKDFYKKLKRSCNSFNTPLEEIEGVSSNILKLNQQQLNRVFDEAFLEECKEINFLDYRIENQEWWIYINSFKEIAIPEDFFAYDEIKIKEKYEEFLKSIETFQKKFENGFRGDSTKEMNQMEIKFCPFLLSTMLHPTISSNITENLKKRIVKVQEKIKNKKASAEECLEEITEIIQKVAKDHDESVFDFWF